MIATLLAYTEGCPHPPLDLKGGQILFQGRVREHLKPGTVIHWITPLPPEEIRDTERAVAQLRSRGIELRLVKYKNHHDLPWIVAKFGDGERRFDRKVENWEGNLREAEARARYAGLLKQTSGFILSPYGRGWYYRGEVCRAVLKTLSKPASQRNFQIDLRLVGRSEVRVEESRDPQALGLISKALDDLSGRSMALLVQTAKIRGWAMVHRYLRAEKERLGELYGKLVGFEPSGPVWVEFGGIPKEVVKDLLDFASHHAPNFSPGRRDDWFAYDVWARENLSN